MRCWMLTFAGKPRNQHLYDHAHEAPIMYWPLVVLAGLSIIGGRWLTEINVTSPTGIVAIDKFNGTDTPALIWRAIERRLNS